MCHFIFNFNAFQSKSSTIAPSSSFLSFSVVPFHSIYLANFNGKLQTLKRWRHFFCKCYCKNFAFQWTVNSEESRWVDFVTQNSISWNHIQRPSNAIWLGSLHAIIAGDKRKTTSELLCTYLQIPPFSQKSLSPSRHNGPTPQSLPLKPGKHEQLYELHEKMEEMKKKNKNYEWIILW